MVQAIGLHILYAEPDSEKCLAGMGRFLDLGDAGLERIIQVNAHPFATQVAKSFFPSGQGSRDAEKVKGMRSGLYWTARNLLNPFDDATVQEVTSGLSDFEPADLVRHDVPTDLYLLMPAGDQDQDSVIISLIISQILRELMGPELDKTVSGYQKKHNVLLFLDEVAALGTMGDFGKKLPQMPGYGITALLIYQSIKQVAVTFGPASGITENFDVIVAGASTDEDTARWLSALVGTATEREKVVSRSRPAGALFGGVETTSERETYRPVMDTGAVFEIPEDEQLVFKKSHRPIWAKKLRYDEEDVFRDRLLPPPPIGDGTGHYPGLNLIESPWWGLRYSNTEAADPAEETADDDLDTDNAFWKVD
jgi:type IV secretion system protein VirD4